MQHDPTVAPRPARTAGGLFADESILDSQSVMRKRFFIEQVAKAFEIMLENRNLKAILVNIFGGIMRCDVVAQGLLDAARTVDLRLPVVVRLEGTNVEIGRKLLEDAGFNMLTADSMDDAARKVVDVAGANRVHLD